MYRKKVEYLRGLADGLNLDPASKEGKLFAAMIDVLGSMADALTEVEDDLADLEELVDELGDELDGIFEDDEEDEDGGGRVCGHGSISRFPELRGDEDDGDEYEITCPGCGHKFAVTEDEIMSGGAPCPGCGEKLAFETDCGCGHCGHKEDKED